MAIPHIQRCYLRLIDGIVTLRNLEGDDPFSVTLAQEDFENFYDRNPQVEFIPDPEGGPADQEVALCQYIKGAVPVVQTGALDRRAVHVAGVVRGASALRVESVP